MTPELLKERLLRVFNGAGFDKILILNTGSADPNFLYVTGFTSGLFEYSYLILDKEKARLFTSALEYETAVAQMVDGLEVIKIESSEQLHDAMRKELDGMRVGIDESFVPVRAYKSIKKNYKPRRLMDSSRAFERARLVKGEDEIASIRKAVGVTKLALVLIQKEFTEGITETELARKFDTLCGSLGSEGSSFKTIVCFGKNAALPHHSPDQTRLRYGDIVLIDAGSKSGNYCSDLTRTFVFGDDKVKIVDWDEKEKLIRIVKDAQVLAIRSIKPGIRGRDVDKVARDYIDGFDNGKYKGTFIHSLGHSLGIEVHDGPGFSPNEETVIMEGMVITAEPGIYINGLGGVRIEDDVLVTKDGALVL